jgi:ribosome-associated protein
MENFNITGEYIQLNQLLKVIGWANDGAEANQLIDDGMVKVNGEVEYRRRNKLFPGFNVTFSEKKVEILPPELK